MKILTSPLKDYQWCFAIPQNEQGATGFVRNQFHLYASLCSHKRKDEVALLYNTLSGEVVILNEQEDLWWKETAQIIHLSTITDEAYHSFILTLIGHHFLVPQHTDMVQVLAQGRKKGRENYIRKSNLIEGYYGYAIFTTTACNARCFYCYEKGYPHHSMTPQTALDTAHFIEQNYRKNHQPVQILWFGGEPLYNQSAIDTIADYLNAHKVPFKSTMISNGYLFTTEVQQRAIDHWHLQHIQITLDGQEERYNRTKNYIYPKDQCNSPYRRVLENILSADEKGINIHIRINVDLHNADELILLTDELAQHIGTRKSHITVYSHALFEHSIHLQGENRKMRIVEAQLRLMKYLNQKNLTQPRSLKPASVSHCMSDNPNHTTIHPDGKLGKCEHYSTDDYAYSDIQGSFFRKDIYDSYFKMSPYVEFCQSCPIMPQCTLLDICEEGSVCDQYVLITKIAECEDTLLMIYKAYLEAHQKGKKTLKETSQQMVSAVKITDMETLQKSVPARVWRYSYNKYAATLPQGTWTLQFLLSFTMGNHEIQKLKFERVDFRSTSFLPLSEETVEQLRRSLTAIGWAYLQEHPHNVLVMQLPPSQHRRVARWFAAFQTQHPEEVTLLQQKTMDKEGKPMNVSIFVSRRCNNYQRVCEALLKQTEKLI